jgi:succinate dehydrogenase / fumarate reductase cytochrome b subunit
MPAIVSILHRMSGVLIFLLLPLITYLFCLSILSEQGYLKVIELLNLWPIQLTKLFLTWGIVHHLIAGCRHLLLDMLIGNDLIVARFTSKTVLIISLLLTLIIYIL